MPPKTDRTPAAAPSAKPVALPEDARRLPRPGTALFWALVVALVAARAAWFQPGALDEGIARALAFAKRTVAVGPAS